jgi:hypothetical protein
LTCFTANRGPDLRFGAPAVLPGQVFRFTGQANKGPQEKSETVYSGNKGHIIVNFASLDK